MDFEKEQQNYRYNQQQTQSLTNSQAYNNYKKWLFENGVLTHKNLEYPSYFGQSSSGVIGCSAKKYINQNQSIIAVPYSLIITASKAKQNPQILKIIQENTHIFGLNYQQQFAILVLYLCRQFVKQDKSFYKPYLQICNTTVIGSWNHWCMLAISNIQVTKLMKRQVQRKQAYFQAFLDIFQRYPQVFKNFTNAQYKKMVGKAYDIINTRSFGWPLKQRSLIPMADSLNHNNYRYVTHTTINIQQINQQQSKNKNKLLNKLNFQIFQQNSKIHQSSNPSKIVKQKKIIRFIDSHKKFLQDTQIQQIQYKQAYILWQQYKKGQRKIQKLHYYNQSCDQDNDTNEDQKQKFQQKQQKMRKEQMKDNKFISYQNMVNKIIKYWRLYVDSVFYKYLANKSQQQQQEQQKQSQKSINQQQQSQQLSSTSSDQEQDSQNQNQNSNFKNQHQTQINKQTNQSDLYFVMATKSPVAVHQQLFTFYGRRNNRFLLAGYNFILPNNKYDSFAFKINIQNWKLTQQPFKQLCIASKLIYRSSKNNNNLYTKQIRLKRCHLCPQLITHCRALLIPNFIQTHQKITNICIYTSTYKQLQQKTLKLADQILQILYKQFLTTQQEDQRQLEKLTKDNQQKDIKEKYQLTTAIKLRIMYKNIIKKNRQFIKLCVDCLKKWENGRIQIKDHKQMKAIGEIKCYLESLQLGKQLL